MSLALDDEQFAAIDPAKRALNRTITELRDKGVREGSIRAIEASLARAAAAEAADPFAHVIEGARYNPVLEAYAPTMHPDHPKDQIADERATLRRRLESKTPPTMEVRFPAYDDRDERIVFNAAETKKYFEGTLAVQESMRTYAVRERRLRTALDAAKALRESGGRRAEVEIGGANQITPDQELCLREFAAVTIGTKYVRENGRRVAREALLLREGWHTKAARALREGTSDLEPRALREFWGFDGEDEVEIVPRPLIGGLVGRGGDSWFGSGARLNLGYGPNEQQMLISEVWDEQYKARAAFATDPFCKQGIKISSNFVYGRGVSVTATSKIVQAVLDEYDQRHTDGAKKKHLRSTLVMGDLFMWKQPLPGGRIRHVKLPAQTIWAIVTLSEDATTPLYYVQRYWTRFQQFAQPDNAAHYVERLLPASDVIHWKINAEEDEIRGRSQAYAALPWHLKFRNHWEAQIEKDYATAAYAYVAFVEGTDAQVRRFVAQNIPKGRVRPGHTRVFNTKVKSFEVVSSDKNLPSGTGSTSEGILNALSANYGFAKEYFGVDGNRTRGGAVTSVGPAEKSFEDLQDDYGEILTQEYQHAIDAAVAYGAIPPIDVDGKPVDLSFSVNFPDIVKADSQVKVLLLVVGRAQGSISHRTFSQQWANSVDLGNSYDYDAEMAQIAKEKAAGIVLPPMPTKFDPIDPTGAANGNLPDPTSMAGQQQIRSDDMNAEVAAYLEASGAILVYP